jgi:chorismate mutase-like protein
MTIDELRRRIDQLDEKLVELLSERANCALQIGQLKHDLGLEVYQPDREAQVLHHVQSHGKLTGSPLGAEAIARVFERIIDEARRIERATAHSSGAATGKVEDR